MKKEYNLFRFALALGAAEFTTDKAYPIIQSAWTKIVPFEGLQILGIMATTGAMMAGITYGADELFYKTGNKMKEIFGKSRKDKIKELKDEAASLKEELEEKEDYSLKL